MRGKAGGGGGGWGGAGKKKRAMGERVGIFRVRGQRK